MKKTLLGLGMAMALTLGGCSPSATDAPSTPSAPATTTSMRTTTDEVASVDLSDSTQPGAMSMTDRDVEPAPMTADGSDGTVARTDDGLLDQNDMVTNKDDVASRGTDVHGNTGMGVEMMALEGNLAEQKLAALALERTQNAEVKKAAQMIQKDHKKAETQLREVVGADLPSTVDLNAEHKNVMNKLEGLNGAEFDKAYVDAMVVDHEKTLAFYQAQAKEAPGEELKGYFAANSRAIQEHLNHCRKLQESMS